MYDCLFYKNIVIFAISKVRSFLNFHKQNLDLIFHLKTKYTQMKTKLFFNGILICLGFIISLSTFAQLQNTSWSATPGNQSVFIENRGQFPVMKTNQLSSKDVLFAYDNGQTKIYFTSTGVTFSFLKKTEKEKDDAETEGKITSISDWKEQEEKEKDIEYETDLVSFKWENANSNAEISGSDVTTDYYSYSFYDNAGKIQNVNHINAYKKITYKNLYPSIDVEFTFHPDDGIKYALILHPGADISKVEMTYSNEPQIKENGDLVMSTLFGNITDHAPSTYYENDLSQEIKSHFVKTKNTITFDLGAYDNSRTIVIDPWVQTPALPSSNGVWECERDGANNIYIIGGDMPEKLLKFNSIGVLQWIYITPYDTANFWLGTLAVDLAGNSYISGGSVAALQKVNTSGSVVWYNPIIPQSIDEYWDIAFNYDQSKLIIGGTSGPGTNFTNGLYGYVFDINASDGTVNSKKLVAYGNMFLIPTNIQEVRSITSSPCGNYYFLTLDTIGCLDPDFFISPSTQPIFKINSTYELGYKSEDFRPNNGNAGIMAIKANNNFVYSQDGDSIAKRSLATGAILSKVAISGGINNVPFFGKHQVGNSGIDIDSCGNVYVGSGNALVKYDANLNFITSVATPFHVYDVVVNNNGEVIVCGATGTMQNQIRTGYVQSFNMSACHSLISSSGNVHVGPNQTICPGQSATLTATGGTAYLWSTGTTTPSITVSPGTTTTYAVTVTVSGGSCSPILTATVNVNNLNANISTVGANCGTTAGLISTNATGGFAPYTYVWNTVPPQYSDTLVNLSPGIYCLTLTDAVGCIIDSCINVPTIQFPTPAICMVSVDTASNHNKIVWNKPNTTAIDQYLIFRETNIAGIYNMIGTQNYSNLSIYTDITSNPLQQSYRYELGVYDVCGQTSMLSPFHQTIHLTVNAGMGGSWNLLWNDYIGYSFSTYNIYRGTSLNNLTQINSVSSNVTSYSDFSPPPGIVYYMIEAVIPTPCNPSKDIEGEFSSISNIAETVLVGVEENESNKYIDIYPNPSSDIFTVSFTDPAFRFANMNIVNLLGQKLNSTLLTQPSQNIDISNFSKGVYFIEIKINEKIYYKKLVIQ
jgi:hypothetical protein